MGRGERNKEAFTPDTGIPQFKFNHQVSFPSRKPAGAKLPDCNLAIIPSAQFEQKQQAERKTSSITQQHDASMSSGRSVRSDSVRSLATGSHSSDNVLYLPAVLNHIPGALLWRATVT